MTILVRHTRGRAWMVTPIEATVVLGLLLCAGRDPRAWSGGEGW